jgi:hypothetical protein
MYWEFLLLLFFILTLNLLNFLNGQVQIPFMGQSIINYGTVHYQFRDSPLSFMGISQYQHEKFKK